MFCSKFCVIKNSKIRFLWHRDNGKIDWDFDMLNSNPGCLQQILSDN